MKIGLDVHGVIDKDPLIFSRLTGKLVGSGNEVHIITGKEISDALVEKLHGFGIYWTHLFSITTHHKKIGTRISFKGGDKTQPLIAPPIWDRTKANYCEKENIDVHIDDSKEYGYYFKKIRTQYVLYSEEFRNLIHFL